MPRYASRRRLRDGRAQTGSTKHTAERRHRGAGSFTSDSRRTRERVLLSSRAGVAVSAMFEVCNVRRSTVRIGARLLVRAGDMCRGRRPLCRADLSRVGVTIVNIGYHDLERANRKGKRDQKRCTTMNHSRRTHDSMLWRSVTAAARFRSMTTTTRD